MNSKRYMISDASRQVDVESHVLRYWEEELGLDIPRNELGHRYYTEENIRVLKNIKILKEQGFQLKAIKMVIPELENTKEANLDYMLALKDELNRQADELEEGETAAAAGGVENISAVGIHSEKDGTGKPVEAFKSQNKMEQFRLIMSDIIADALRDNNASLGREVSERVSDSVLKEMDYLMRVREEKEDERYKQLDETIRTYQKNRREQKNDKKEAKREAKRLKAINAQRKKTLRKARATG